MKHEYHEDPEAHERFEKSMTALFRASKTPANSCVKTLVPIKSIHLQANKPLQHEK